MNEEAVIHMCNGILLSHKNKCIWVSSNEVDEPRAYYTEWCKSEREKLISHMSTYVWNLERWWYRTYLQGRSGDMDIENRLVDTEETDGDSSLETYALPFVK